jgi:hypothetical protein
VQLTALKYSVSEFMQEFGSMLWVVTTGIAFLTILKPSGYLMVYLSKIPLSAHAAVFMCFVWI